MGTLKNTFALNRNTHMPEPLETELVPDALGLLDGVTRIPQDQIESEEGCCYVVAVHSLTDIQSDGPGSNASRLLLFEDGRSLGPAHCSHVDVRELGAGRFSHWSGQLYFSTSDNSDPRSNGRSYALATVNEDRLKHYLPEDNDAPAQEDAFAKQWAALEHANGSCVYHLKAFRGLQQCLSGYGITSMEGLHFMELGCGWNTAMAVYLFAAGAAGYVGMEVQDVHLEGAVYRNAFELARIMDDQAAGRLSSLSVGADKRALDRARARFVPASAVWPIKDGSVDVSFSVAVFEHVRDMNQIAAELFRTMRPGGIGIHQVDFRDHRNFESPLDFLEFPREQWESMTTDADYTNRLRSSETRAILEEAGFEILAAESNSPTPPPPIDDALRGRLHPDFRDMPAEILQELSVQYVIRRRENSG